ncbi:hypothetical protein PROFUN_13893 [Planoprotostelium fungivorum]|uniref:OTU domain-containing protein n=1 Tax=Planoprotostelium fungivorum TaxID=1890364 RepID=A0A2P6N298_9EUKA|nr:hypothetical protein PROFUN_13893 [Planoprotostelium fungivorum]
MEFQSCRPQQKFASKWEKCKTPGKLGQDPSEELIFTLQHPYNYAQPHPSADVWKEEEDRRTLALLFLLRGQRHTDHDWNVSAERTPGVSAERTPGVSAERTPGVSAERTPSVSAETHPLSFLFRTIKNQITEVTMSDDDRLRKIIRSHAEDIVSTWRLASRIIDDIPLNTSLRSRFCEIGNITYKNFARDRRTASASFKNRCIAAINTIAFPPVDDFSESEEDSDSDDEDQTDIEVVPPEDLDVKGFVRRISEGRFKAAYDGLLQWVRQHLNEKIPEELVQLLSIVGYQGDKALPSWTKIEMVSIGQSPVGTVPGIGHTIYHEYMAVKESVLLLGSKTAFINALSGPCESLGYKYTLAELDGMRNIARLLLFCFPKVKLVRLLGKHAAKVFNMHKGLCRFKLEYKTRILFGPAVQVMQFKHPKWTGNYTSNSDYDTIVAECKKKLKEKVQSHQVDVGEEVAKLFEYQKDSFRSFPKIVETKRDKNKKPETENIHKERLVHSQAAANALPIIKSNSVGVKGDSSNIFQPPPSVLIKQKKSPIDDVKEELVIAEDPPAIDGVADIGNSALVQEYSKTAVETNKPKEYVLYTASPPNQREIAEFSHNYGMALRPVGDIWALVFTSQDSAAKVQQLINDKILSAIDQLSTSLAYIDIGECGQHQKRAQDPTPIVDPFDLIDLPAGGEGDCMFNVIAEQIGEESLSIRNDVANFLDSTSGCYIGKDGGLVNVEEFAGQSLKEYTDAIRRPGTWGDHLVFEVLAQLHPELHFVIHTLNEIIEIGTGEKIIRLAFVPELHYKSVS